jgi:hypothetical protein
VKITLIATGYDVSDIPGMPSNLKKVINDQKKSPATTVLFGEDGDESIETVVPVPEPEKPVYDIDKTISKYYSNKNEPSPAPSPSPSPSPVPSPSPSPSLFSSGNDFETVTLDDYEDDEQVKKAENIPAWKRKFLNR